MVDFIDKISRWNLVNIWLEQPDVDLLRPAGSNPLTP